MTQGTTLITGGAGFIGSHLAHHLVSQGKSVRVIDNLSTGRMSNLADAMDRGRCECLRGSVSQVLASQPTCLDQVTQIYHLAATVGVRMAMEHPAATLENNINETRALFAAASDRGIPVLLASSSEVYGKNTHTPLNEDDNLVLGPSTSPRWSYALSKVVDEQLAWDYHRQRKLAVVIVRLFNTIGPRQVGDYGMVVPRFIQQAMRNEPLTIFGTGEQRRCFCDVRDVVRAMARLLDSPSLHGQVYNVGHDQPVSINELAGLVIKLAASRSVVRHVAYDQAYAAGLDDPQDRVPDLTRLRKAIRWTPDYDLQATVSDLIDSPCVVSSPGSPGSPGS